MNSATYNFKGDFFLSTFWIPFYMFLRCLDEKTSILEKKKSVAKTIHNELYAFKLDYWACPETSPISAKLLTN